MACCLSPSCCPGRRSGRRSATKSSGRRLTGVCRPSKSVASSVAEPPTPRTSTVVPDVVDRLRRRLCQDSGSGTDNDGVSQRRTPCRCCRRCLGENNGQQVTNSIELNRSTVHPTRLSPTPSKPAVSGTTPGTTEVGNTDFMTLFFRNCERIVLDNAAAIHEMLSAPAHDEEEQRENTGDDWTSNRTEPSSSTDTVEQRRRLSRDDDDDDDVADNLRSDIASAMTESELPRTEDAGNSTSDGRTDGAVERLIAPANSPVSAGSLLTSSLSDDALLTTKCACSPLMKVADVADDHLFVRRRPSVSGQSPAAVTDINWTADGCRSSWRRPRRPVVVRTSTDDNDDGHIEVVFKQKSATNRMTTFPVGLGSRPPCLGQECSPIRSTPCGAGRETGSSAATAGTTSGDASQRVLPPGRVDLGRVAAFRRRRRRRSAPLHRRPAPLPYVPSPAVVQQSYRKVDTWLRHHATPEIENGDVTPVFGHGPTPENHLKRKLLRGEAKSAIKRRVTDSDSCSLPSGTFTSDDEEDEVDHNDDNGVDCAATKDPWAGQRRVFPAALGSPSVQSAARPRVAKTSPRWKKRSPLVNSVYSRRRRTRKYGGGETGDLSSGVLGDRSSSLATSGDLSPCRRQPSTVCRSLTAAKTAATTSRKNVVERRREFLRRVTRMARRLHRVAAADAQADIHVQTLAVL